MKDKYEGYAFIPQTVEESRRKNKEDNENTKFLIEHFKDKDPKLVDLLKNDISLMPSDVEFVDEAYDEKER